MLQVNQIKCPINHSKPQLLRAISRKLDCGEEQILDYKVLRRSVDARKKPDLFFQYTLAVSLKNENRILSRKKKDRDISLYEPLEYRFPQPGTVPLHHRPVIIGMGPAGLFCGLELARQGYRPLLLERGQDVDQRTKDVLNFWNGEKLNPDSNVQFGEGGAGTFSDGKLNTLVKDSSGRNRKVLETFVEFGADESILYDHKPHIGTDKLREIVKRMRKAILDAGGEVRFSSHVTDFCIQDGKITGVCINDSEWMDCEVVILAIGHSARDTFERLLGRNLSMEPKAFAIGYRVIHPQSFINQSQYGKSDVPELGAAPYKVTAMASDGRGVYSFCMCPGGYVVNASSEMGRLAVNGMSYSGRNSSCANSAIIVSVTPDDFHYDGPLAGVYFQRDLEEKAYRAGKGSIPVQTYGDFRSKIVEKNNMKLSGTETEAFCFEPKIKGKYEMADLTEVMPDECNKAFVEGMEQIDKKIHGFANPGVYLCGLESRTSSPVRILRDDNLESNIKGIYPCGEGAGYAGGITSAAMDGLKIAQQIGVVYQP